MRRQMTQEEYKNIEEWLYNGKSIKQIARLLKIPRSNLYELMNSDKRLKDTISMGIEFSEGWWEEMGQEHLGNKNFNYQGWYMNMRNRFGWCDKSEHKAKVSVEEVSNKVDENLAKYEKPF